MTNVANTKTYSFSSVPGLIGWGREIDDPRSKGPSRLSDVSVSPSGVCRAVYDGFLQTVGQVDASQTTAFVADLLTSGQRTRLQENGAVDVGAYAPHLGRLRVNVSFGDDPTLRDDRRSSHDLGSTFEERPLWLRVRLHPDHIPTLESLRFDDDVISLLRDADTGLVLLVGPQRVGKTTLAARHAQMRLDAKAISVRTGEDPIEYALQHGLGEVQQCEIGMHVDSFERWIWSNVRSGANGLMLSELRSGETIRGAARAAEMGMWVCGTTHGDSVVGGVRRIIAEVAQSEQDLLREQLASALFGVIAITLVHDRKGRLIPVTEVLRLDAGGARGVIRKGDLDALNHVISDAGWSTGLHSFHHAAERLVAHEDIDVSAVAHLLGGQ